MINLRIHFTDILYLAFWILQRGGVDTEVRFSKSPGVRGSVVGGVCGCADDIWLLVLKTGASHSQTILFIESPSEQGQLFCSIALGFHLGEDPHHHERSRF